MMEQVTSDYFQFLENVTLVMQKKKKTAGSWCASVKYDLTSCQSK